MSDLGTRSTVVQSFPNDPASPGGQFLRNPAKEFVIGGAWNAFTANGGFLLAQVYDDVVRQYGPRVYELMINDDAVYASLHLLLAAIFAEGLKLRPACEQEPGEDLKKSKRSRRRDVKLAGDILEFCERGILGLDSDINEELWQLGSAMPFGCGICENVIADTPAESGPDKGRQCPTKVHFKPRWAYAFRVNMFMEALAIRAWTVEGWRDIDAAKFMVLSWRPQNRDPRGSSILRPAFIPWNAKLESSRDHREFLRHHADPSLKITAGEKQIDQQITDPVTGVVTMVSPAQQNLEAAQHYRNRSILSLPNGADADLMEQKSNGQPYELAFDRWDRQIFRVILGSTRPFQEAKHGSKADTDTGKDFFQMVVQSARKPFLAAIERGLLFRWVEANWGTEIAKRLTPKASFGLTDDMSPELIQAFTQAWNGGVFQLPQRPWMLHKLGAPVDPDEYTPVQKGVTDVAPADPPDTEQPSAKPRGGKEPTDPGAGGGDANDKPGDDEGDNQESTGYG